MELNRLLLSLYPELPTQFHSINIEHLSTHTSNLKDNTLFLLTEGENFDPHTMIESISSSVSFFISERTLPSDVPHIVDVDLKQKVGSIFSEFLGNPERSMEHIGVTGTNGKTSIASIIQYIFQEVRNTSYIGTLGIQVNGESFPFDFDTPTTPQANDLSLLFETFRKKNVNLNVMEVSSHSLDQGRTAFIPFKYAIFSNLTVDHLDYHGTFDSYFKSKKRLFDGLGNESTAITNIDDSYGLPIVSDAKGEVFTYSIHLPSDLQATDINLTESGTSFNILYQDESIPFHTQLIGHFNIYNLLSAISVALLENISIYVIQKRISSFEGVPGRLEKVFSSTRNVFVDYAHTPDGLESVLTALNQLKGEHSIITVFGCGGDRDVSKRPMMGSISDNLSDITIVTSDNPRNEDPEHVLDDIISGIHGDYHRIVERDKAIELAVRLSAADDLILIAGKGHENYQIIGDNRIEFDDRKVASKFLDHLN